MEERRNSQWHSAGQGHPQRQPQQYAHRFHSHGQRSLLQRQRRNTRKGIVEK